MSVGRDPELEREFLERAIIQARPHVRRGGQSGTNGYLARVRGRLEKGAGEYGALGYLDRRVEELLEELRQEGEDAAGWAVLIAQRLQREQLGVDLHSELRLLLEQIAALGVQIDGLVDRIRRALAASG